MVEAFTAFRNAGPIFVCVYIYIYIYIYMCVCVCVCVYVCIYIYLKVKFPLTGPVWPIGVFSENYNQPIINVLNTIHDQ